MKKNLLLLAMIAIAFTSCAVQAETIVPSKNYITKKVKVDSFDGISTATSINVVYTQVSGSPDVEVYAPENLMEYVKVEVEDDMLKVKFQSKDNPFNGVNISGKHQTEVRVSAPAVHVLHASSSGDIVLKNGLRIQGQVTMKSSSSGDIEGGEVVCDELIASASSSGDVILNQVECTSMHADASSSGDVEIKYLVAETVQADASSSGDVILGGECRSANLSASSSGDVQAKDLKANKVVARASSAGDVTCYPVESLEATASSSGSVNYKGDPKHIDFHPKKGLNKID
ncbi:MAG: DUF2807 domain-containing protein [Bacteroides sp.]|nr:DUF2807 domain-containing protein [Bacteroides sp.]